MKNRNLSYEISKHIINLCLDLDNEEMFIKNILLKDEDDVEFNHKIYGGSVKDLKLIFIPFNFSQENILLFSIDSTIWYCIYVSEQYVLFSFTKNTIDNQIEISLSQQADILRCFENIFDIGFSFEKISIDIIPSVLNKILNETIFK